MSKSHVISKLRYNYQKSLNPTKIKYPTTVNTCFHPTPN